ncbi:hypothetical protein LTR73_007332 [Friedmanniomyces endolithicus]|nr:hypothetical protein LTR73_007332 [Friedmanniomyces endolithicus]
MAKPRTMLSSATLFTTLLHILTLTNAQTCYFTDGSAAVDDTPCLDTIPAGRASPCCSKLDICLTNGYCLNAGTTFNRGSCTDQTWNSADCTHQCTQKKYSGIWPCAGGTFSCQLGNCTETFSIPSGGLTINDATLRALNVSYSALAGTAATATSTVTVTPSSALATSTVTVAPSSTALTGDYVSRGTAAGIGAGIGVPLLCALVAVSAMLVVEKRRQKNVQSTDESATRSGGQDLPESFSPQSRRGDGRGEAYHEMAPAKPQEMDNQQRLFELANGPR